MWFRFVCVNCPGGGGDEWRGIGISYQQSGGYQLSTNLLGRVHERHRDHFYRDGSERFDVRRLVGALLGNKWDLQLDSHEEYDRYGSIQWHGNIGDHTHYLHGPGESISG
jgi:hypothetical protein